MISIDENSCIKCGHCIEVCPARIFTFKEINGEKRLFSRNENYCIVCGHCVAICPKDAIIHKKFALDTFKELKHPTSTPEEIETLLLGRRSIRVYKDEPVAQDIIQNLLHYAIYAGTASNAQNLHFTVIKDKKKIEELENLVIITLWNQLKLIRNPILRIVARFIYGKNQVQGYFNYYLVVKGYMERGEIKKFIFRGAPVVVIIDAPKKDFFGYSNAALAISNINLLAQTYNLGVCWIGFLMEASRRSKKIRNFINLKKSQKIYGCCVLGHPKYNYKKSVPRKEPEVKWV